jgi:hypothetical protein
MLPTDYKARVGARPMSEVINPSRFMTEGEEKKKKKKKKTQCIKTSCFSLADTAGNWYEDLKNYESNLDEMASATLDQVNVVQSTSTRVLLIKYITEFQGRNAAC